MKKIIVILAMTFGLMLAGVSSAAPDANAQLQQALKTKNYQQAFKISSEFAKKGDAAGQYVLGRLYLGGQGVRKDPKQGFNWTNKSAGQQYLRAMHTLGVLYASGIGTGKNMKQASLWFTRAGQKGFID